MEEALRWCLISTEPEILLFYLVCFTAEINFGKNCLTSLILQNHYESTIFKVGSFYRTTNTAKLAVQCLASQETECI